MPHKKRLRGESVDSPAEFAKPVYLVAAAPVAGAGAEQEEEEAAYSVFRVQVAAGDERPRANYVARLPGAEHMSFSVVHPKGRSLIVGVGGPEGATVIHDPSTQTTYKGRYLSRPKRNPVLISHGAKVYAVSRRPCVYRDHQSDFDFEPWFESLDFNKPVPCIRSMDSPVWDRLPPPPFFPCFLDPLEYRNPPDVSVSSYAAVGPYILLSLHQQGTGTYGFHVRKKSWKKVSDKNLPFVGQAIPLPGHCGSLFVAHQLSAPTAAASVFHMRIKSVSSNSVLSGNLTASVLSIKEFPVAPSEGVIPRPIQKLPVASQEEVYWPLLSALGNGSFCSIRLVSFRRSRESSTKLKSLKIILTTFQIMDNAEAILAACETEAEADCLHVVRVKKQHRNETCKLKDRSFFLACPMPVVAALSMDSAY